MLEQLLKDKNIELAGISSRFQDQFLSAQSKRAKEFNDEFAKLKANFEDTANLTLNNIKAKQRGSRRKYMSL
jgi:hypothetical protein